MIIRIYWFICALLVLAALAVLAVGSFSMMAGVIFGFIGFGVLFMGIIAVMPIWISHPVKLEIPAAAKNAETVQAGEPVRTETLSAASGGLRVMQVGMRN